jgi:hypothetical protein
MIAQVISLVFAASNPEDVLYGYGPLGVAVVVLTIAIIKLFNVILKDRDRVIVQRDTLIEDYFTKVLPGITKTTEVLQARQGLDKEVLDSLKDISYGLQQNQQLLSEIKIMVTLGRGGNADSGGN